MMTEKQAEIRVGVVGVRRGRSFAAGAAHAGMRLVAICDEKAANLDEVARSFGVRGYRDYEQFLEHDMDAVILANYFHQHAPLAMRALERGLHVMSETTSCATLAEGVALVRAVEKSGRIYMLAENYPYTAAKQEMARLYRSGEIGEVRYAEGEYIHQVSPEESMRLAPHVDHWRWHMPATYYCTHALAPLMAITDTMPVRVNALAIPMHPDEFHGLYRRDTASVILCRMENGAVFRLVQGRLPAASSYSCVYGLRGMMETVKGDGAKVRVVHEPWNRPPGQPLERVYRAEFPEHGELARRAGHGGGDFWTNYHFAEAIRRGAQPYLDVYRGVTMSAVGILAWKSALADGAPQDIPDFRDEKARAAYEDDHWSPFPEHAGPGQPPSSIQGRIEPSEADLAFAREIWSRMADGAGSGRK